VVTWEHNSYYLLHKVIAKFKCSDYVLCGGKFLSGVKFHHLPHVGCGKNLSCENFAWTECVKLMWCLSIYYLVCKYCRSESGLICPAWKLWHAVESCRSLLVCCKLWGLCCLRNLKQCESPCVKRKWTLQVILCTALHCFCPAINVTAVPTLCFWTEDNYISHTQERASCTTKLMHIVSCLVLLYSKWYSSILLIFLATKGRIFWYWNSSNTLNTTDCAMGGMRRVWVWRISSCRYSHMRVDLAIAWLIRVCGTRGSLQVYLVITMLTVSHF